MEYRTFSVRTPAETHRLIEDIAKREHRSVNGQVLHLLEIALAEEIAQGGAPPADLGSDGFPASIVTDRGTSSLEAAR